jgi:hypothetical protein
MLFLADVTPDTGYNGILTRLLGNQFTGEKSTL